MAGGVHTNDVWHGVRKGMWIAAGGTGMDSTVRRWKNVVGMLNDMDTIPV